MNGLIGSIINTLWFIDTDYNEESFFVRHAYFLGAATYPYKNLTQKSPSRAHQRPQTADDPTTVARAGDHDGR